MKRFAFLLLALISGTLCIAQDCALEENLVVVTVQTDPYGYESSWDIKDGQGEIIFSGGDFDNNELYIDSFCITSGSCLTFSFYDAFSDGFAPPGYASLEFNGEQLAFLTNFGAEYNTEFDCNAGQSCGDAIEVGEEIFPFNSEGEWFKFTPSINGVYRVTTCDDIVCDTKIWIYDGCGDILVVDGHEGTTFFADDGDCGVQAEVSGIMIGGDDYLIRVRSEDPACVGDSLAISFVNPILGCTDPDACNYNPLATEDDGSCVLDSEDCPSPDLLMDVGALRNSISIKQETNTDQCLINEGCMRGYGVRDVINFRTVIANVGDADYFIGAPEENPDQFDFDNCHNHYHYGGYAEYVLYDEYGQYIPIGFKNGFCVIDLNCPSQDMYKYSCNYMGLSAGCLDIYAENLPCQWIDITDVPDGNYTFVTRVNWDNAPDAIGQMESDTVNNWAQVCIVLDRSSGELTLDLVDDCDPYIDCLGNIYGKAEIDCKGECNGPAMRGDLDEDGSLSSIDRFMYADQALEKVAASACSDLNTDGQITVYDAMLLTDCMLNGDDHFHEDGTAAHDHCTFPRGIYNSTTLTEFEISEATNEYFVVSMRNSASDIIAYQLEFAGVQIDDIENLVDEYVAETILKSNNTNNLLVMSESDSFIPKSAEYSNILKVYYSLPTDEEVCLEVIDVVNAKYEQVDAIETTACASLDGVSTIDYSRDKINIYPNPFSNETIIEMEEPGGYQIKLLDASGKLVRQEILDGKKLVLKKENLLEGIYFMTIQNDKVAYRSKLIIQ